MSVRGRLQDGIYFAPGERPGRFFALIFLAVDPAASAARIGGELASLWSMYAGLERGVVRDLAPEVVPHECDQMTKLLGFGPQAFDLVGRMHSAPQGLGDDNQFRDPQEGGGPLLHGSGLRYAPEVRTNPAANPFCIQVIADTKLAIDRAVVETWKLLHDGPVEPGQSSLQLAHFYLGFQRPDRRSWIDFHDGLSNLHADERHAAIAIDGGLTQDDWCQGGSYLAFARIAVDLPAWRELDRTEQELLVGRDKLSGCPLTGRAVDGAPQTSPSCPVGGSAIWETPNDPLFAEPPAVNDPRLRASHVQRANHHVPNASDPSGRRIFRQGYEFLEWNEASPGFRAGLNFVSFQDDPARLIKMLTADGWLGGVNFGGPTDGSAATPELLSIWAAGIYLVPPAESSGEPFPGASLFGGSVAQATQGTGTGS